MCHCVFERSGALFGLLNNQRNVRLFQLTCSRCRRADREGVQAKICFRTPGADACPTAGVGIIGGRDHGLPIDHAGKSIPNHLNGKGVFAAQKFNTRILHLRQRWVDFAPIDPFTDHKVARAGIILENISIGTQPGITGAEKDPVAFAIAQDSPVHLGDIIRCLIVKGTGIEHAAATFNAGPAFRALPGAILVLPLAWIAEIIYTKRVGGLGPGRGAGRGCLAGVVGKTSSRPAVNIT